MLLPCAHSWAGSCLIHEDRGGAPIFLPSSRPSPLLDAALCSCRLCKCAHHWQGKMRGSGQDAGQHCWDLSVHRCASGASLLARWAPQPSRCSCWFWIAFAAIPCFFIDEGTAATMQPWLTAKSMLCTMGSAGPMI